MEECSGGKDTRNSMVVSDRVRSKWNKRSRTNDFQESKNNGAVALNDQEDGEKCCTALWV